MRCLKTKAGAEHLQTFKDVHALLLRRGIHPKYCRMDNECSAPIKQFIKDENMNLQLTPPQMHRQNWAERAIQTGKAHLIAGLVGINPNFPPTPVVQIDTPVRANTKHDAPHPHQSQNLSRYLPPRYSQLQRSTISSPWNSHGDTKIT